MNEQRTIKKKEYFPSSERHIQRIFILSITFMIEPNI